MSAVRAFDDLFDEEPSSLADPGKPWGADDQRRMRSVAERSIRLRQEWAEALLRRTSDLILLTDVNGTITWAGENSVSVVGHPADRLVGTSCLDLVHPEDRDAAVAAFVLEASGDPERHPPLVIRILHADGTPRWLSVTAGNLLDDEAVASVVISARDISELRRSDELLAEETEMLEAIARGTPLDGVLTSVASMVERAVDHACCSVGVIGTDQVVRHPCAPSLPPRLASTLDATSPTSELGASVRESDPAVFRSIASDDRWAAMHELLAASGLNACWTWQVRAPSNGEMLGLLAVFLREDRGPHPSELPLLARAQHLAAIAIERARFESRLEHQALHDALTGLPNRTLLLDRIAQSVAACRRNDSRAAVLFIDVDRFKVINDSLGHTAGDLLLGALVERFSATLPEGDTIGRFGGDEFVVLAHSGEEDAVCLAEALAASLEAPFEIGGVEVVVTCSIGIALADGTRAAEVLVRDADAAMYRAKDEGRNRFALFEERLHRRMVRRLELERDLRSALATDALRVHYQPIMRLADSRVTGVEALVRWKRPGRGLVGAAQLVPVAEETGLIVPIGAWVLEQACRQAASWHTDGYDLVTSVNLSARQLADPRLVETVAMILDRTELPADRLCLEVTESALAADADDSVVLLGALKLLGVRLAIDDFGTGYATLDYVKRFSMADELKLDKSFVDGLADVTEADAAIVSVAILLADALDFATVAEGVETPEQLAVLRQLGCHAAQGYLFAEPMAAKAIEPMFTR